MPFNLERAKSRLVEVLQEEYEHQIQEDHDPPNVPLAMLQRYFETEGADKSYIQTVLEHRLFVRKNSPHIIATGGRQIVLRLGHGAAAKLIRPESEQTLDDWHVINPRRSYPRELFDVAHTLREFAPVLGYDVPAHEYLRLKYNHALVNAVEPMPHGERNAHTVITRDLTEDGDKLVQELNIDQFMALENSLELLGQYQRIAEFFLGMHKDYQEYKRGAGPKPEYGIEATAHKSHAPDAHPQVAINRMLLVQIEPKSNTGKIVCGDLDHLRVWKLE